MRKLKGKSHISGENYLYIPLEIYRRELNGMLLLSLIAVKRGWKVVIGGKRALFPLLDSFPEGVVLLKSVVPGEIDLQSRIRGFGHKVASIDAEGLLPSNGRSGVELRYSHETIKKADMLFFWGMDQFKQVEKYIPSVKSCGVITGSPIFDYWKALKRLNKKKKCPDKKTILIATSFPYPNHFINKEMSYSAVRDASGSGATEDHFKEIFLDGKLQNLIYPQFKGLAESIIKNNPEVKIILRPHPSENPEPWEALAKYENVEMSKSGEISPILLESDILFHFNSTTSIEAHYYGKNIITYIPEDLPIELSNRLNQYALKSSVISKNVEDLMEKIEASLKGLKLEVDLDLNTLVKDCFDQRVSSSSENILDELSKFGQISISRDFPSLVKIRFSPKALYSHLRLRLVWFAGWLDHLTGILSGKYSSQKDIFRYGKTKQGELPISELRQKVESLAEVLDIDSEEIGLKKLRNGLFKIEVTS
ncbi:MAG: hypothetical protein K9K67_00880 [Bacteriovoracaceae bacterium]|nr:hypothetical protein [Bacteriovoracaceae bacterium]